MSASHPHRGLLPVQGKFSNIFCAHSAFWGKRLNHVFIRASGEKRSISSDILFSSFVIIAACIGSTFGRPKNCLASAGVQSISDLHDYSTPCLFLSHTPACRSHPAGLRRLIRFANADDPSFDHLVGDGEQLTPPCRRGTRRCDGARATFVEAHNATNSLTRPAPHTALVRIPRARRQPDGARNRRVLVQ